MGIWRKISAALGFGGARTPAVPSYAAEGVGAGVGLAAAPDSPALSELERRISDAFRATFMEHVRSRVMAATPSMSDDLYDWALLELRRFFFMTAILQGQVPMYSAHADAIWHEMLLFTREYDAFCRSFAGRIINHEPHLSKPSKEEASRIRREFELVYGSLFQVLPPNERLLGRFRKTSFPMQEVMHLQSMDAQAIRKRWFRDDDQAAAEAAWNLAESVKKGADRAMQRGQDEPLLPADYAAWLIAMSVWDGATKKYVGDTSAGVYGAAHTIDGSSDSSDSGGGGASCGGGCGGS